MSIFDRITRLARAEANDLADKVKGAIDELRSGDSPDDESAQAEADLKRDHDAQETYWRQHAAKDRDAGSSWPRQIREDYAALELPLGSDRKEAKQAYRTMMRRYHPDKHQGNPEQARLANEVSMRLRQSYERLDEFLEARQRG